MKVNFGLSGKKNHISGTQSEEVKFLHGVVEYWPKYQQLNELENENA
jgi:hypothetical protein